MTARLCALLVAATLSLPVARAFAAPPGTGWTEIAHFNGLVPVSAAMLSGGTGSFGDPNFAMPATAYNGLGDQFTLAVEMGVYLDYFRPASPGLTVGNVLTSQIRHAWSASPVGPFVAPAYYTQYLGGSAVGWPSDGRSYLSFWGSNQGVPGGCCASQVGGPLSWGQAFKIYLKSEQPVPVAPGSWSGLKVRL